MKGSAMNIGPELLPVFQQLGIYEEFLTIGKHLKHTLGFTVSLKSLKPAQGTQTTSLLAFISTTSSSDRYPLKRSIGHRVLNVTEEDEKVIVHLSNNSTFKGDIVVGADGTYSAVHQRMYEQLKSKEELPKSDQEELPFSCTCLVGQTKALDPELFPIVKERYCQFLTVLGDNKPFTWSILSIAHGTLCWSVIHHLNEKTSKKVMEQRFRNNDNAEWGAYPAQIMCEETRNFPILLNDDKKHTLGDIYDLSAKELISKVMLEEKVFTTWHSGHAVTAMHDAIALANLLYVMPTRTSQNFTKLFEEYQAERHSAVTEAFKSSQLMSKFMEKGVIGAIILFILSHIPFWLWKLMLAMTVRCHPQIGYLEPIALFGSVVCIVSHSEQKARYVFEKQQKQV
ncbi:hypothetical protein BG015_006593 [Linnemannia schmuckeri]|uniref:FAD-binding domain-containing protein n=1 Tax=Linnemannia schmuckeri TaxID=64567 RepID=A0A9P5S342_9FUNG|nr:hypothetical protein BG015_006593 [Linnemannia schmuckeri]